MKFITAIAAVAVAVLQFYADTEIFSGIFSGKALKCIGILAAKLLVYAGAFAFLFLHARAYVIYAAIGFGVGFFPALFTYTLIKIKNNR